MSPGGEIESILNFPQNDFAPAQFSSAGPVIVAGDQTLTALRGNGYLVAGSSIQPNDPVITVSDTHVSLGSSAKGVPLVGSTTVALTEIANDNLTAAGNEWTPIHHDKILVQDHTNPVGDCKITVPGNIIASAFSGLTLSGQIYAVTASVSKFGGLSSVLTIAGHKVTVFAGPSVLIEGATLLFNGLPTAVSSAVFPLAPGVVIVNARAHPLPTLSASILPSPIVVLINGRPLIGDGHVITIAGATLSLTSASAGLFITRMDAELSTFSIPVRSRESMTINAVNVVENLPEHEEYSQFKGEIGSLIMFEFERFTQSTASMACAPSHTISYNPTFSTNVTHSSKGWRQRL